MDTYKIFENALNMHYQWLVCLRAVQFLGATSSVSITNQQSRVNNIYQILPAIQILGFFVEPEMN